jgi:phosphoserine phosphatase RsbU/P
MRPRPSVVTEIDEQLAHRLLVVPAQLTRATPSPAPAEDRPFGPITALARTMLSAPVAFVVPAVAFVVPAVGCGAPSAEVSRGAEWAGTEWAAGTRPDRLAEAFRDILLGGAPMTVCDTRAEPGTRDDPRVAAAGVAAWTCASVDGPAGEKLALFCVLDTAARAWTDRDQKTVEGLARVAAGELRVRGDLASARRDTERLRALTAQGQALRMGLLPPRLSGVPGMQVAARTLPAADGLGALGDFYDVFPVRLRADTDSGPPALAERWDAVIGDVSGHGPEAATFTALARYTLRAVATAEKTPSQVLNRLNTALLTRADDSERFLTATYVMLFPVLGGIDAFLTSAGHMPALLRDSAGSVRTVGHHGLPLGLFDQPGLSNVRVTLEPGDTLLLYTDGVTEARRGRAQYGEDRLRALFAAGTGLSAHDLVDAIEADVLAFTGGSHTDDIAALALHVTDVSDATGHVE